MIQPLMRFVDVFSVIQIHRCDKNVAVFNDTNHSVVTNSVAPKACKVALEGFSEASGVSRVQDFLNVLLELLLNRFVQFKELLFSLSGEDQVPFFNRHCLKDQPFFEPLPKTYLYHHFLGVARKGTQLFGFPVASLSIHQGPHVSNSSLVDVFPLRACLTLFPYLQEVEK